jgi:uncharacterized membrane protein
MKKGMTTKTAMLIVGALILASVLITAYFYGDLPQDVAMHWNSAGDANGFADKSWSMFLLPAIGALLSLLLFALPSIDPLRKGFTDFRKGYDLLVVTVAGFLSLLQVLVVIWNLGWHFDFSRFMAPTIGTFFIVLGTILPTFKRNWFAGIRTPWTLSSDEVWKKTHVHAGIVFQLIGIVACFGTILPRYSFHFLFVPAILGVFWVILYSYILYRSAQK